MTFNLLKTLVSDGSCSKNIKELQYIKEQLEEIQKVVSNKTLQLQTIIKIKKEHYNSSIAEKKAILRREEEEYEKIKADAKKEIEKKIQKQACKTREKLIGEGNGPNII